MQLPPDLAQSLQSQLTLERTNSAAYRAMGHALENVNWPGSARHFMAASADEQAHADKIAAYLIDRNEHPQYAPLEAPIVPVPDLLPMFQAALEREQMTTLAIKALFWQAFALSDEATVHMLGWFVAEQVDSEREYLDIIMELSRADDEATKVLLDREYGK